MRGRKNKSTYLPTDEEQKALHWCINNNIYISPFCKEYFVSWYIDIKINGKLNRSPITYAQDELWQMIFNYYKYYYDKYKK